MRNKDLRNILLPAFLIPYFVVFLLSGIFIINTLSKIDELNDVRKLIPPLTELSELITLLNEEKYAQTLLKVANIKENFPFSAEDKVDLALRRLKLTLESDDIWKKYCSCSDIYLLEVTIKKLRKKRTSSVKEILVDYDRVINNLCSYYAALSSVFHLKFIGLQFKTLYTLYKFHTVSTDLAAETLAYTVGKNPSYPYAYYYYKGEILSYADTYYALIDIPLYKRLFKLHLYQSEFLRKLLENPQAFRTPGEVSDAFASYVENYNDYRRNLLNKLNGDLDRYYERYKFQIFGVIFLTFLAILSLLIIHFWVYRYGIVKYEETFQKFERRIYRDPLTGLLNRRFFNVYLLKKLKELHGKGEKISFILLDIDNFKHINDTYGHDFGDKVLRQVARVLRSSIRRDDIAIRWGGEEFGIFVNAPLPIAVKLAERIRQILERNPVEGVKVTASFGVGEYRGEDPKEFFRKVDEALYRAKRNGKNRVEIAL